MTCPSTSSTWLTSGIDMGDAVARRVGSAAFVLDPQSDQTGIPAPRSGGEVVVPLGSSTDGESFGSLARMNLRQSHPCPVRLLGSERASSLK
mmetsp:Transcript_21963/g.55409  ORF Transcript_21963/g.55409 Transcript_21963/m.55409 type:complete len:92 (-) Transcript_21963:42-317(-)